MSSIKRATQFQLCFSNNFFLKGLSNNPSCPSYYKMPLIIFPTFLYVFNSILGSISYFNLWCQYQFFSTTVALNCFNIRCFSEMSWLFFHVNFVISLSGYVLFPICIYVFIYLHAFLWHFRGILWKLHCTYRLIQGELACI